MANQNTELGDGHRAAQDPERADAPAVGVGHLLGLVRASIPPIHPGGYPLIAAAGGAALLARRLWRPLGVFGALATAGVALFFREPERTPPHDESLVVAAADGQVAKVDRAVPPAELGLGDRPLARVSTFLTVLDVHVQRAPVEGSIKKVAYHPGKFLSADLDKASEDNERNTVLFSTDSGQDVVVVQIAGLLARRIVNDAVEGDRFSQGQTYGLIRFGSRVDVYLPEGSTVLVRPGQRTIGGETPLAQLPGA